MTINNEHKKLNVPNLRFPEFQGEWKVESIKDVADFMGGGTPSSSNESFWQGTIPWVSSSDIVENDIKNISISRYITEEAIAHSATKLCPAPSILIVSRVGVGKIALSKEAICTSQDFCNLINIKVEPIFLTYCLSQIMKRKSMEVQGTSIKGITTSEIQKISINIPSLQEQKKIGKILSLLDERIATQNKIIEDLKKLKCAIAERLFKVTNGEVVALSGVCNIQKGKQVNGDCLSETGTYYVMNGGTEPSGYYEQCNAPADTISISEGGNSCGYIQYNRDAFWSGGHCYTLTDIQSNVCNLYLYHYLKSKESTIMKLRIGTGLPNIQKKDLEKFAVLLPPVAKQVRISTFLTAIERKTTNEEILLSHFQEEKQYLLRQMFI